MFDHVLQRPKRLEFIWTVEQCTSGEKFAQANDVKDLNRICDLGFSLQNTIMVDDTPEKLRLTPDNLIPISPFLGNDKDRELLYLMDYLLTISEEDRLDLRDKTAWRASYPNPPANNDKYIPIHYCPVK